MKKAGISFLTLLTSLFIAGSTAAHVALDYPAGGETFTAGETVDIQWHILIPHDQENWDLYFSPDGGTNWETIQLDLPVSQLNYQWTVPELATEQARIKIYMDNTVGSYEDASGDFTIQEASTSVQMQSEHPQISELYSNYPNPFNPITLIGYKLSNAGNVQLTIYNQLGEQIKTLVNEKQSAGFYQVQWDGRDNKGEPVSNGVYLYRLKAGSFIQTRKMVLSR